MKKLFGILLVAALLLPVLAGCQSSAEPAPQAGASANSPAAQPQNEQVPAPAAEQPAEPAPAASSPEYITREEAKAIALKDAGLAEADVRDLEVDLDLDDGPAHYDVDFEKGEKDYDYDIDAVTGEILRVQKPAKETSSEPTQKPTTSDNSSSGSTNSNNSSTGSTTEKQLTKAEAKAIALKHAGVKESEVRDLDVELDRDDGTLHYDVDFEKDGYDYEYEIDAKTGKILKSRKERD